MGRGRRGRWAAMEESGMILTRRRLLATAAAAATGAMLGRTGAAGALADGPAPAAAPAAKHRYLVGGCDWIMLKRQKLGGVKLAAELGLDGLEVDMGGLGNRPNFDNQLRDPAVRQQYLDACREHNVQICSLAMSAFYAQSYADHPAADACTEDVLQTLPLMGVKVAFLPMGVRSDVVNDTAARKAIVERLRRYAPAFEKAGLVMGVEASLDADGYRRFFDEVGSPAVQSYYNLQSGLDAGADIYSDLRVLAKSSQLCQVHATDHDGKLLKDSRIDLPKFKAALDESGWAGWLVLERSRVSGKTMRQDFAANAALLKSVFQAG